MDKIEVSICIPVYNAEKYIKRTIESILNQTFSNFELIIIDNCSTDNTMNIIKQFVDNRIKLYKNETNLGMVKNWNECLKRVKGNYIYIVCADDLLDKHCIMEKFNIMQNNKDIVMAVSNTSIIDTNEKLIFTRRLCWRNKIIDGKKIAKKSFRTKNRFGEPSNTMFRADISKNIGMFNEKLSYTPDWEYWLRLAKHGKVAYINKTLSRFRIISNSGSAYLLEKSNLMREDDKMFIESIKNVYGNEIKSIDIFMHKLIRHSKIIFKKNFLYYIC